MRVFFSKRNIPTYFVLLFFVILVLFFFRKVFQGFIPIPVDILTGAYYPWLDYSYGYAVHVPIKNASLSDVYSQLYPWRALGMDIIRSGQIPLWNPYTFSGSPLLANWQSAIFYPLNILMLLLGNMKGWVTIIILQPFLSLVFMYIYLREINLTRLAAVFGSIIFAFSGFMVIFLEYSFPGQTGLWLPLLLLCVERYAKSLKGRYLFFSSCIVATIILAGHFQAAAYSLIIASLYGCFRLRIGGQETALILKRSGILLVFLILGIGLASIQIFPLLELFPLSIRTLDNNIKEYNYGIIPLKQIITFLAPDFFGNPATNNSRAYIYHETMAYFGVTAIPFVLVALWKKRNFLTIFFGSIFIISIVFAFNTGFSKLPYLINMPLFSTSYASRLIYLIGFSAAILAAVGFDYIKESIAPFRKIATWMGATVVGIFIGVFVSRYILTHNPFTQAFYLADLSVTIRNLIFPIGLSSAALVLMFLPIPKKVIQLAFVLLITVDLFRFGLKYTPFVPKRLFYPTTPTIEYLQINTGDYRFDKDTSEIMPSNSWMPYGLTSPSGYDPLYPKNYAAFYNIMNGNLPDDNVTRYLNLEKIDTPFLDLAGVKYLVSPKRDSTNTIRPEGNILPAKLDSGRYQPVFDDRSMVILENKTVLPRAHLYYDATVEPSNIKALQLLNNQFDFRNRIIVNQEVGMQISNKQATGTATISAYTANNVIISATTTAPALLMLSDTMYPGWRVFVNNNPAELLTAFGVYRAVAIPEGKHTIAFSYQPKSFLLGILGSMISLLLLIAGVIFYSKSYRQNLD